MRRTRRETLRDLAALAGGAVAWLRAFTPDGARAAAPSAAPSNWTRFVSSEWGIALQHPAGWTVRALETGATAVTEGADGLTGARAYGQILPLNRGTTSGILVDLLGQRLALSFDDFRAVQTVRVSTFPDLSILRYTVPYIDGPRKGTIVAATVPGAGVLLGIDAPVSAYAERREILLNVLMSFRWFVPTLNQHPVVEPREGAYTVLVPAGWRPTLSVIRPAIDAGFVASATDPSGLLSAEVHRPQTPGFIAPSPLLREGTWYDLGNKWGMQPLYVSRYLPGGEYIRRFLLPVAKRTRPDISITGVRARPDLTLSPDTAAARRLGATPAGVEADYVWTGARGVRMRGRVIVLTVDNPSPGLTLWGVPFLLTAEAPEPQYAAALAAALTMSGSFTLNVIWYATELRAAAQRWRIIMDTERLLWTKYQEVQLNRANVALKSYNEWDKYIRGPQALTDYVITGEDTIRGEDGQIHHVTGIGGKTVSQWAQEHPDRHLVEW